MLRSLTLDIFQTDSSGLSPEECEGTDGYHRDPEDCSHYYICTHNGEEWTVEEDYCVDGTMFDTELNVCNWESEVDCSN